MAASRNQRVQPGGMWNTPKANYSRETQNLLKDMMRESKLNNFQQRQLTSVVSGGGTLPQDGVNPTSSARVRKPASSSPSRQLPKVLNGRNISAQIRTKDAIEQSGAYEREKYIPSGPSYYAEDKDKFINKMTYGDELPPTDWKELLDRVDPDPVPDKDRFDELQEEIEERRKFLADMVKLGKGHKYETIINTEISQKIREMEIVDKKRTVELERRLAADK